MKRLIAYFVSGVRTGSFFYLALLLLGQLFPQLIYPKVSVGNILALFMMSGLMGMLSWILEELDRMSYRLRVVLHFLLTAIVLTVNCLHFRLYYYLALSHLANAYENTAY